MATLLRNGRKYVLLRIGVNPTSRT